MVAVAYHWTRVSRVLLFRTAFILTRPLGATVGDFLDKPLAHGGLALSRPLASAVLAACILRAAGVIPLHDQAAVSAKESARLRALGDRSGWNAVAFATSFQITMLEGMEVVFIVIATGAGGAGLLMPACCGALAALLVVIALCFAVHRPLASVPENTLKFAIGALLSGFGTFWMGEGLAISWPGGDRATLALSLGFLIVALAILLLCRARIAKGEPI